MAAATPGMHAQTQDSGPLAESKMVNRLRESKSPYVSLPRPLRTGYMAQELTKSNVLGQGPYAQPGGLADVGCREHESGQEVQQTDLSQYWLFRMSLYVTL